MARYIHRRTEEEKRNLKVNLRRVPEWKSQIESIRAHFNQFSLPKVLMAAALIHEIRNKLHIGSSYDRGRDAKFLERWKISLSVDDLIRMGDGYSAPNFLKNKEDIIEKIRSELAGAEHQLAVSRAKGITDSVFVSMFTSKVNNETIEQLQKRKDYYLALSKEIPRVAEAVRLLNDVLSESRRFAKDFSKIQNQLWLAEEKKEAIERFEAKHGKVFAKAAAVDNKTRGRASSLRRLVERTKDCPYCGNDLGGNPHLDHIYPVSKGGLSTVENLVWCCSACNTAKTDKGLMQFLKERRLPIDRTLSRLHDLGKHV